MSKRRHFFLSFAALLIFGVTTIAQDETLSNDGVIELTRAGFAKSLIIQKIQTTKTKFETTVRKLVELKTAGVSEDVISEMLRAKPTATATTTETTTVETRPVSSDLPTTKNPVVKQPTPSGGENNGARPVTTGTPIPQIDSKANNYAAASPVMVDKAKTIAGLYIEAKENGESEADAVGLYTELFAYSIARSIETDNETASAVVNLQPLRFAPEMYRSDKQIGSSASTMASTSAIDKPGFVNLLGVAVENGFIEQNVRDTVLTLSTSPSAFFSINQKDHTKAYQDAGFLNKIGLSASFNINNNNPLLNNVSTGNLKEFSVRYRFWGDHSARSKALAEIWKRDVEPEIIKLLTQIGQVMEVVDNTAALRDLRNKNQKEFVTAAKAKYDSADFKALAADKRETELTNFILNFLKATVADQITGGKLNLTEDEKNGLRSNMNSLLAVQKKQAFDIIQSKLDEFFKKPIGTVAYSNHRDVLGNYSQMKLLLMFNDTIFKPLSFNLNAGVSWYHKPNALLNQKRVRDFDFALSLEGKRTVSYLKDGDFSPITYSFTGRYQRLFENETLATRKADLLKAQFLITFPLFSGISLPFSATYSNATELERKQGFRVNFGIKFDADKFFDLQRIWKTP